MEDIAIRGWTSFSTESGRWYNPVQHRCSSSVQSCCPASRSGLQEEPFRVSLAAWQQYHPAASVVVLSTAEKPVAALPEGRPIKDAIDMELEELRKKARE